MTRDQRLTQIRDELYSINGISEPKSQGIAVRIYDLEQAALASQKVPEGMMLVPRHVLDRVNRFRHSDNSCLRFVPDATNDAIDDIEKLLAAAPAAEQEGG